MTQRQKKTPQKKIAFYLLLFSFLFFFRQHRPSVSESSEYSSQAELTMEFSISPAPPSSIPTSTNQNSSQFDSPQSQNQQTEPTKIGPYMSNDIPAENAADAPWRGILRKTESKINLNE